jgi:hypothetical protein
MSAYKKKINLMIQREYDILNPSGAGNKTFLERNVSQKWANLKPDFIQLLYLTL